MEHLQVTQKSTHEEDERLKHLQKIFDDIFSQICEKSSGKSGHEKIVIDLRDNNLSPLLTKAVVWGIADSMARAENSLQIRSILILEKLIDPDHDIFMIHGIWRKIDKEDDIGVRSVLGNIEINGGITPEDVNNAIKILL